MTNPLTFVMTSNGRICWKTNDPSFIKTIQYRKSNESESSWHTLTPSLNPESDDGAHIDVSNGETIFFQGTDEACANNNDKYCSFSGTAGTFKVKDNLYSLTNGNIGDYYFKSLFSSCTGLTDATELNLPGSLGRYCYQYMFYNCTSLTAAPTRLPVTTLKEGCYKEMFYGCTSLTQAPELPATTLAPHCYSSMFNGCTSLTQAPHLTAATVMQPYCYFGMFRGCTALNQFPALPASTLAEYCYANMFQGCKMATNPPALGASPLAVGCYYNMFYGCLSIGRAPDLNSATLVNDCYKNMFSYCSGLNEIKCLATSLDAPKCTENWVLGVAEEGTFSAAADTSWSRGVSGIPERWNTSTEPTVAPLTFTIEGSGEIVWTKVGSPATRTIQYRRKLSSEGTYSGWFDVDGDHWQTNGNSLKLRVDNGQKIQFKGTNLSYCENEGAYYSFSGTTAKFSVSANIMSLIKGDDFGTITVLEANNTFQKLFYNCTGLTSAKDLTLPAMTLKTSCYESMFQGCTGLTRGPALPATTLAANCYDSMFYGCKKLTTAPALSTGALAPSCYDSMFWGCTSLTTAPALTAKTLASTCYSAMFRGCTGLTTIPAELPATTLANSCYDSMFAGCTKIKNIPTFPETISTFPSQCCQHMFSGCSSLVSGVTSNLTLGNSNTTMGTNCCCEMFYGCTNLKKAPKLPATTLGTNCYTDMFESCGSLTTTGIPPSLPATTMADSCYAGMFSFCTSLTGVPSNYLPATTLATYCYNSMFRGCTSLTQAPELPAETLANYCYSYMFSDCNLTTAPELPAPTRAANCYMGMFNECSRLNYIKCLAMHDGTRGEYLDTLYWTEGVASEGTFVKDAADNNWPIGENGIPEGWRILNADGISIDVESENIPVPKAGANNLLIKIYSFQNWEASMPSSTAQWIQINPTAGNPEGGDAIEIDLTAQTLAAGNSREGIITFSCDKNSVICKVKQSDSFKEPLTFEIVDAGGDGKISWTHVRPANTSSNPDYWTSNPLKIQYRKNGGSWTDITSDEAASAPTISVTTNDIIQFKGNNAQYGNIYGDRINWYNKFTSTDCTFKVKGNAMSLIDDTDFSALTKFDTTVNYHFRGLFAHCTGLTDASELVLPSMELSLGSYYQMFSGCTSLTQAPELPAKRLPEYCYGYMFQGCTSLNKITCLAENIGNLHCTEEWVANVASSGDFYHKDGMYNAWNDKPTNSGIPTGWNHHGAS